MKPGRNIIGTDVISIIVDSIPIPTSPPSNIISIFPFMSSNTCSALVGLGRPEVLALGAAIGVCTAFKKESAPKWFGIRIATVSKPPVVVYGTFSFFSKIIVSGPGQNDSISFFAFSGIFFTICSNCFSSAI